MMIQNVERLMEALRLFFAALDEWNSCGTTLVNDKLYIAMTQRRDDVRMIFEELRLAS